MIPARFKVLRDDTCIGCGICVRECAFGVHSISKEKKLSADSSKCVDCQRCVEKCPKGSLSIIRNPNIFHPNSSWPQNALEEIYRQAEALLAQECPVIPIHNYVATALVSGRVQGFTRNSNGHPNFEYCTIAE